jgi:vacuolar protein sorting-associated protein 18
MALEPSSGYVPATDFQDVPEEALPMFVVERVQLQFPRPSDFVAAQIANNAIFLAFSTGRILRIDLQDAAEIEGTAFAIYQLTQTDRDYLCRHRPT